ncbi:hypothetical protein K1719_020341 [Acacia pycnantha]|nr:hypothetical protein K1719_020341 [Acacia pycnantha]
METKQKTRYVRKLRRRCGFDEEWFVAPIGRSFNGFRFTWCNNREEPDTIRERIDRALGNLQLQELFPNLQVFNVDPVVSNRRQFMVDDTCSAFDAFVYNLGKCKEDMVQWSNKEFPNIAKAIHVLKTKLVTLYAGGLNADSTRAIADVKIAQDRLFDLEEKFWWQRSPLNWLTVGDKNSCFFHLSTIKRRQQNAFFQNLFSSSSPRDMNSVLFVIDSKITVEMNLCLMRPFSREKIKEAAFSLGGSKAPDPNDFSGMFYHNAWSKIGDSCTMVQEVFAGISLLNIINETNITLIPKVDNPEHVSHFCPIGLCNFSYKIISKLMSNRLRSFLDNCIS